MKLSDIIRRLLDLKEWAKALPKRARGLLSSAANKAAWKIIGNELDGGQERVPIYSYPRRFRSLFSICLLLGTAGICGVRVWLKLGDAGFGDNLKTTTDIALDVLPTSGISSVIIAIVIMEGIEVIAELLKNREKDRKISELAAQREAAMQEAKQERARAETAEAKVEELQRKLDALNGNAGQQSP